MFKDMLATTTENKEIKIKVPINYMPNLFTKKKNSKNQKFKNETDNHEQKSQDSSSYVVVRSHEHKC